VEADGTYDLGLASPNLENHEAIGLRQAVRMAQDFVRRQGLDTNDLTFDRILLKNTAGGTGAGSGELQAPRVTETVVQFTQLVNGLPVLAPGRGQVSVSVDNDGQVTALRNTSRPIRELSDLPGTNPRAPGESSTPAASLDPEVLLAEAFQDRMKDWVVKGRMPVGFKDVPGTAEIGYTYAGDVAILVARKEVEVDFGGGILKRYEIQVPLAE
jgi:hypothetical protein